MRGMTTTNAPAGTPAPAAPAQPAATGQAPPAGQPADGDELPRDWAGIALDVAGCAAAAILLVIIADVWTEGKLSGWWRARRAAQHAPAPQE